MGDLDSKNLKLIQLASCSMNKEFAAEKMKKATSVTTNESSQTSSNIKFYLANDNNTTPNSSVTTSPNRDELKSEKVSVVLTPSDSPSESGESKTNRAFNKRRLYVKNIEWEVHENMLKRFLNKFGAIKKCKIIRDDQNRSKGFGFVEFADEAAATRALKAPKSELLLSARTLVLAYYQERRHTNSTSSNHSKASSTVKIEETTNHAKVTEADSGMDTTGTTTIYDLPYNVLVNIFSRLCLRDLCMVEQVSKLWYDIAHITWSTKQRLILDKKNIYDTYKSRKVNRWGFTVIPVFDNKSLRQVLAKKFGHNLKYLDLSGCVSFNGLTLQLVGEECPNITYLNLSKLDLSNYSVTKLIKRCNKLKHLILANCNNITDSTLARVFRDLKDIEVLDLTNCNLIVGKSFYNASNSLKQIILDQCESIESQALLELFKRNTHLNKVSIKRTKPINPDVAIHLINNMTSLQYLGLSSCNLDNVPQAFDEIKYHQLQSLRSFDASESVAQNQFISNLLYNCRSLISVNLKSCTNLSDKAFTSLPIHSPIEEIDLSVDYELTDATLEALAQVGGTLKTLKIRGPNKITNQAVKNLLVNFPKLTHLDCKYVDVDNSLLYFAIENFPDRKLFIYCDGALVDTTEFVFKYPETEKQNLNFNYFSYKYGNLTFETSATANKRGNPWSEFGNSGMIFIGSVSSNDDEELDFNNLDFNYINEGNEDDEEEEYADDLADFEEEDQEMYNELDEY